MLTSAGHTCQLGTEFRLVCLGECGSTVTQENEDTDLLHCLWSEGSWGDRKRGVLREGKNCDPRSSSLRVTLLVSLSHLLHARTVAPLTPLSGAQGRDRQHLYEFICQARDLPHFHPFMPEDCGTEYQSLSLQTLFHFWFPNYSGLTFFQKHKEVRFLL